MLNKQVLSPVLKESREPGERRAAGNLFQHLGPAAEKARSPNRVFIRLTRRSHLSIDRSLNPEADECVSLQYSRKYPGAANNLRLNTDKTSKMVITKKGKARSPPIQGIIRVASLIILGVIINENLH